MDAKQQVDALQTARACMEKNPDSGTTWVETAMAYAAIAQAEQLKRIADALENINMAYTVTEFGALPTAGVTIHSSDKEPVGPSPLDNF